MSYSAYELSDSSRARLLAEIKPLFEKVICHHITYQFPSDKTPPSGLCRVVGYAHNDCIQALVVEVNGTTVRPDGKTFHITMSLNPKRAKPVDSNSMLVREGWRKLSAPIEIIVKPRVF